MVEDEDLRTNDETRRQHRGKPGVGKSDPERGVRAPRVGKPGVGCPESPERGRVTGA